MGNPKGNKRKNQQRKNGNRQTANLSRRGRNVHSSVSIDRVYRERRGNKGYSSDTAAVYAQVQRAEVGERPILQPVGVQLQTETGAKLGQAGVCPATGITTDHRTRVTVTIGAQASGANWGFLLIKQDMTGPGGQTWPVSTPMNTTASQIDMMYTTGAFTSTTLDFTTINLATTGITGVMGADTAVQAPFTVAAITSNAYGSHQYACLGQTISLAANRSSVTSRKGQIAVKHCKTVLAPGVLSPTALDNDLRAEIFDAADLTPDSQFKTHRPTWACGRWNSLPKSTNYRGWLGTGAIPTSLAAGYTLIIATGNAGDEYVFEIDTAMAWAGDQIPVDIQMCYSFNAYSEVSCGRTAATRGTSTTTNEDAAQDGRIAHREMEKSAAARVPEFIMDKLMNEGSKLFSRAVSAVL